MPIRDVAVATLEGDVRALLLLEVREKVLAPALVLRVVREDALSSLGLALLRLLYIYKGIL